MKSKVPIEVPIFTADIPEETSPVQDIVFQSDYMFLLGFITPLNFAQQTVSQYAYGVAPELFHRQAHHVLLQSFY